MSAASSFNEAFSSLSEREQQHVKLDAAGLIPGLGVVFDGANAIIYLTEGDFANAGVSGLALLPVGGEFIGALSVGGKVVKIANKADDVAKVTKATKTIDDIIDESVFIKKKKAIQYGKSGSYEDAFNDFNALDLKNVKQYEERKWVGYLDDGRKVVVREESSFEAPTLEIQDENKNRKIKIRYISNEG